VTQWIAIGISVVALAFTGAAAAAAVRSARASEASAAAARETVQVEVHRRHEELGPRGPHGVKFDGGSYRAETGQQITTLVNMTGRTFTYRGDLVYDNGSRKPVFPEELRPGSGTPLPVSTPNGANPANYVELWFDGECVCDKPEGERGHWKWTHTVPGLHAAAGPVIYDKPPP
jgi:hypothetical protein